MEEKYKVSVIAPVYGTEKYIERCFHSLMRQTLDSIQYIFVDDATPDRSVSLIRELLSLYPNRINDVIIVQHDVNKGLPAARNTGLELVEGEYVYHCDSDDYVERDLLECLYNECKKHNRDWAYCDFFLTYDSNERQIGYPKVDINREAINLMLSGRMKYNVWNKLIKSTLYKNITFPVGKSMGEDMTILKVILNAKSVGCVSKPLYHYVQYNLGAMSHNYRDESKLNQLKENTDDVVQYICSNSNLSKDSKIIKWFLLNVKLPLLFTGEKQDFLTWKKWYPQANNEILSNHYLPMRTRVIEIFAKLNLYGLIKLYNSLFIKLIYGVIYK